MADAIDKACEREQMDRDLAIASARKNNGTAKATGHCLSCNAALDQGKRWCDTECREDWELEQESKKRHRGRG
ncbi:DUF2116 family Zn-ribbon domain-containing protein [Flavobacterium sp.]|jgi:hypothetical protein|uniref:DUF2116 family Zn-ribbon domain-containing protein n=1 Tax=Flavobacterium sp. TaxID=239 RepID=UPI0037BF2049